jgi:hypothetical protein
MVSPKSPLYVACVAYSLVQMLRSADAQFSDWISSHRHTCTFGITESGEAEAMSNPADMCMRVFRAVDVFGDCCLGVPFAQSVVFTAFRP